MKQWRRLLLMVCGGLAMVVGMACQTAVSPTPPPPTRPAAITEPAATAAAAAASDEPANDYTRIVAPGELGEPLHIEIQIQDQQTGEPIPAAALWIRQTDDAGFYQEDASGNPRISGRLRSDGAGKIQVATILPGRYPDDPTASRHIHLTVEAAGYEPLERVLLFDNDPHLTAAERNFAFAVVAEMAQDEIGAWLTTIALALTPASGPDLQTYELVPAQSTAAYAVEEEFFPRQDWLDAHQLTAGMATAVGVTNEISGMMQLDLSQTPPAVGENQFSVDLSTLESDQAGRDNVLRRDFFSEPHTHLAAFEIHTLSDFSGDIQMDVPVFFTMAGDLTIHGVAEPAAFDVAATWGAETVTGTAVTEFPMSRFGMTPPSLLGILSVSDRVRVTLTFTFVEMGGVGGG